MMVYVMRSSLGDCTNGGVSSKHDQLFIKLPHYPADDKTPADVPVMVLEAHHAGCVRLRPAGEKRWCMFGGNFAHSSDSRFSEAIEKLLGHRFYGAVAIHDRIEG